MSTPVNMGMTGDPKTVTPDDDAVDALTTMVSNHFRHLPVMK